MITTGERQYGTLDEIRKDHLARYEFVTRLISPDDMVIDAACGCGYGTWLLAGKAALVFGYDNNEEALEYANKHYSKDGIVYRMTELPWGLHDVICDAAVCFETIEHIKNPLQLLKNLKIYGKKLFASVPNQDRLPFRKEQFPFHHRHYTKEEFEKLLNRAGWVVKQWYGQEDAWSDVKEDVNGRTLVVECV